MLNARSQWLKHAMREKWPCWEGQLEMKDWCWFILYRLCFWKVHFFYSLCAVLLCFWRSEMPWTKLQYISVRRNHAEWQIKDSNIENKTTMGNTWLILGFFKTFVNIGKFEHLIFPRTIICWKGNCMHSAQTTQKIYQAWGPRFWTGRKTAHRKSLLVSF